MKKGWLETRKRMLKNNMENPEYLKTSYDRQAEVQEKLKFNDTRKRVA